MENEKVITEMSQSEYEEKLATIERNFDKAKKQLYYDYGMSHAKFKTGDIIKDHRFAILIDKVTVSKSFGLPEPVYSGYELKKDLTPRKDGSRSSIYGNKGVELIKSA